MIWNGQDDYMLFSVSIPTIDLKTFMHPMWVILTTVLALLAANVRNFWVFVGYLVVIATFSNYHTQFLIKEVKEHFKSDTSKLDAEIAKRVAAEKERDDAKSLQTAAEMLQDDRMSGGDAKYAALLKRYREMEVRNGELSLENRGSNARIAELQGVITALTNRLENAEAEKRSVRFARSALAEPRSDVNVYDGGLDYMPTHQQAAFSRNAGLGFGAQYGGNRAFGAPQEDRGRVPSSSFGGFPNSVGNDIGDY
jgi:hypothetical protein